MVTPLTMRCTGNPVFVFATIAMTACGGATAQSSTTTETTGSSHSTTQSMTASSGASATNDRCAAMGASGGITIEGQLGTLRQSAVSATLNAALNRIQRCYTTRLEEHPYLSGAVQYKIRIGTDGFVRWVLPTQSTLGDRATEQCMVEILRGLRFPEPCGGEAETTWGPSFEGGEDVRPAVAWETSRIQQQLTRRRAQLMQCLGAATGASAQVTLYVGQGGRVITAGAAVSTHEADSALACLVHEVSAWRGLPDPGSYPAKVSFTVP